MFQLSKTNLYRNWKHQHKKNFKMRFQDLVECYRMSMASLTVDMTVECYGMSMASLTVDMTHLTRESTLSKYFI